MEPTAKAITTKIASGLSAAAKESGAGFIKTVLHAPAEALGGLIADPINARRHANLIKIAAKAKKLLDKAGIPPHEVPLSIIHPALEAASLEEDEDLQGIWANLLANTADIRQVDVISPSFPMILKELTARDVKFLDVLYQDAEGLTKKDDYVRRVHGRKIPRVPVTIDDVYYGFEEIENLYAKSVLGITAIKGAEQKVLLSQTFTFSLDLAVRHRLLDKDFELDVAKHEKAPPQVYVSYRFSCLGARFVAACRPPGKAS